MTILETLYVRSVIRLWLSSGDGDVPSAIAKILDMTPGEVENILRQLAGNGAEGQSGALLALFFLFI